MDATKRKIKKSQDVREGSGSFLYSLMVCLCFSIVLIRWRVQAASRLILIRSGSFVSKNVLSPRHLGKDPEAAEVR
jgi:hypothetical protein